MRTTLWLMLVLCALEINAQEKYYDDPLKIQMLLSGSFAELRANHFHSGIDIKTQGATGLPVYAVADGYISRISVSPSGFGNALYINHPNGTTSVYGHLERFSPEIKKTAYPF
ncbi:MAG: M23 family metallopeptidase [Draconibacterium sp.]